jgi:hypothetical protein
VFYDLGCKKKEVLEEYIDANERKRQAAVVVVSVSCKAIPIGEFAV